MEVEAIKELKQVTLESLRADSACVDGIAIAKTLIDDPQGAEKAYDNHYEYWLWALEHGYDVLSGLSEEWRKERNFGQVISNSGDAGSASNSGVRGSASNSGYAGSASNSGYAGSASNSGYAGSASNSGDAGSASNSGDAGFAIAMRGSRAMSTVDNACLVVCYHDDNGIARCASGVTGENDIEAGVWYGADTKIGKLVKSADQSSPEVAE